jgi:CRP-like cAMP-binding protein
MTTPDIVGLLALVLLLAAAWAKPVEWLRGLSAVANLAMVAYGIITAQYPLALLSALILAVNAWRLYETRTLVSVTRDATAASAAPITMDWLLPYMRPLALPIEEIGVEMGKGALFGEIGIFSHDKRRTATAKTLEDTALMQVSADKVRELYYQNPDFGFFIVDLITRRLMEDAAAGTLKP